jgi:hypothetical protein
MLSLAFGRSVSPLRCLYVDALLQFGSPVRPVCQFLAYETYAPTVLYRNGTANNPVMYNEVIHHSYDSTTWSRFTAGTTLTGDRTVVVDANTQLSENMTESLRERPVDLMKRGWS